MSKERETLITDLSINAGDGFFYITQKLQAEIRELLAQPEQNKAEAIMPNGVCVSNVYDAYEEGRKSVIVEQEPLTNEQKSAEAALEQALRDTVDEERIRQIFINCISFN